MGWILKLLNWFSGLWKNLSTEQKKRIIEIIIATFLKIFRNIYRYYKTKKDKNNTDKTNKTDKEEKVNISSFFSEKCQESDLSLNASITNLSNQLNNIFEFRGNKEKEFSDNVSKMVHSKDFLSELSQMISVPSENESEEDFIERAGEIMKYLLYKKFIPEQ